MRQAAVTVEQAYRELNAEAFALWLRLMIVPDAALESRAALARYVSVPLRSVNRYLRELRNKGYVTLLKGTKKGAISGPTQIRLNARLALVGAHRVMTLA